MTTAVPVPHQPVEEWHQPSRGIVGMACLITAESAIFVIFVTAYLYYLGKSLTGPAPHDVLDAPIFATVCLLSSSITVHFSVHELRAVRIARSAWWLAATVLLGSIFIGFTAFEWYDLINHHGLTISTNLFGTTFYSLVGLHASHVLVGLILLSLALIFSIAGKVTEHHAERLEVLSLYWHFVDAVWVVVFTVVYIIGR
ncbi:MAG TPA: cytochrome c oxidase subunit 3 [Terracidiphilus sp.]|nr:cytochrome c oxidase subunit 3 [Terracidiphilus sp.]